MENVLDLDNMANEAKNLIQSGDAKGARTAQASSKNEASKHPILVDSWWSNGKIRLTRSCYISH